MSSKPNSDEIKGRVKQAAGDLTGNDDLKAEGEIDEATGKAKRVVDNVADRVADKANDAIDKLKGNN